MTAPSAFRIEQAMSAYFAARTRLVETDPDSAALLSEAESDVYVLLDRLVHTAIDAGRLADDADDYAKTIAGRKARFQRREEALRGIVFAIMDALGESRVERGVYTACINRGRSSVVITDVDKLPADCLRTTVAPDKAAIAERMKQGEVIDGAEWSNPAPVLSVRVK